jgi:hypothetical protein
MVAYALMLQFSLTAFLITGAFLGRAYFDYFFTLVACTIVLTRMRKLDADARADGELEGEEISPSEAEEPTTEVQEAVYRRSAPGYAGHR